MFLLVVVKQGEDVMLKLTSISYEEAKARYTCKTWKTVITNNICRMIRTGALGFGVVTLFFLALATQACHIPTHVAKREITTTTRDQLAVENIESYFPRCLTTETNFDGVDYDSVVKFLVEYSRWYTISNDVTCSASNDTVECWIWRLKSLLGDGSIQLAAAEECVKKFYFYATYGYDDAAFERPQNSAGYQDRENDDACPQRTEDNYDLCVNDYLAKYQGQTNPIGNFKSVLGFVEQKVQCSETNCNCGDVITRDSLVTTYFETTNLQCDSCWATRVGALVEDDSVLTDAIRACASTIGDQPVAPERSDTRLKTY